MLSLFTKYLPLSLMLTTTGDDSLCHGCCPQDSRTTTTTSTDPDQRLHTALAASTTLHYGFVINGWMATH